MRIEEAIKQKAPFRDNHQKMMVNLIYTYSWMIERSKRFFINWELTPQQYNILRILRGAERILSTNDIRDRLLDKMSDTPRMVDRLILKNLVTKSLNRQDKRKVEIRITEKGLSILEEIDGVMPKLLSELHGLDPSEAEQLSNLLDKLRNNQNLTII